MSGALFPTKTRLALLQAVADGAVTERYPLGVEPHYSQWDLGPGGAHGTYGNRHRTVTAGVADQQRAGWIRLGEPEDPTWYKSPRLWEITDLGSQILAARAKELAS